MSDNDRELQLPRVDLQCTEMVHTIFDRSVGHCYGSFSCTYKRQHGRLYVARRAVLFFSNLFGYERRLSMFLSEVTDVNIHRSTSIWISMMDGEEFIFKSLSDRERVLGIIKALLALMTPRASPTVEVLASSTSESSLLLEQELVASASANNQQRGRSHSCPTDIARVEESSSGDPMNETIDLGIIAEHPPERKVSNGEVSTATSNCTEDLLEAWSKEKQCQESNFTERAVDGLKVKCSIGDFFDKFLADDASHSVEQFQTDQIGDTQVQATNWILEDDGSMTRTITFCHPISNKFGVGPSSAMATRRQTLKRYGDFGMCMEASTAIEGVPAADTFYVSDRWLLEESGAAIKFTVLYKTVFTKRTMFKRMIEQSTKSELKSWYEGYVKVLMMQTQDSVTAANESPVQLAVDKSDVVKMPTRVLLLLPIILVVLFAVIIQNWILHSQVQQLQSEVIAMRAEQVAVVQLFYQSTTVKSGQ